MSNGDEFVDAYSVITGIKQRVPRHWITDPVLGRDLRLTPSQRELDGDLGPRPREDDTVKDIDKYADKAGIDLSGTSTKSEKVAAVEAAFGPGDTVTGLVEVEPEPPAPDPLNPATVALVDHDGNATPISTDDTGSSDESPATGNEEN